MHNSVLVVGTGTIGEPLAGLLAKQGKNLGIDEVMFYKHTPRRTDYPLVKGLLRKGATLSTNRENFETFREMGIEPTYTFEEALDNSKVVADCSPTNKGLINKEKFYIKWKDKVEAFLAQGSEFGFGAMYATGINDIILDSNKFIHIVSCNTHNISVIIKNLAFNPDDYLNRKRKNWGTSQLREGSFLAIRRASDISQSGDFIPSPEVGTHKDPIFGTHHSRDAFELFNTLGYTYGDLHLFSSAIKLNTQFMHVIHFDLKIKKELSKTDVINRFIEDPYIAITHKRQASQVFSFGREHGHFGRILDQSVVILPTIHVQKAKHVNDGTRIVGYCFTPQDGNSLLSSATAITYYENDLQEEAWERLKTLNQYMFDEV